MTRELTLAGGPGLRHRAAFGGAAPVNVDVPRPGRALRPARLRTHCSADVDLRRMPGVEPKDAEKLARYRKAWSDRQPGQMF